MDFRIADTFTDSLARLTGDEQKAVKTTAFDLQIDPANPGMQFHKLDKAKDRNFWSVRVSGDLRLIVHRTKTSLLLCYVDHHDAAYRWAERRKLETHPKTGAAQLVELRETVREIVVEQYLQATRPAAPKRALFAKLSDEELLGFGVPTEWLADVKQADEDRLLLLADHLPREAAEALLNLATGVAPRSAPQAVAGADPFEHPDAHRFSTRFLWSEWIDVVDAWQLENWEAYRTVARLGRKTRLAEPQRRMLWDIFERVRAALDDRRLVTPAAVFTLATKYPGENDPHRYDNVVVDEAQDLSVPQLRFLAALASAGPNSLFFAADLGQRIFQPPFSWKSLGVDIRGRSQTLRINYRTSHQIRRKADRLRPSELADLDSNAEERRGTVSVFNGPEPAIEIFATQHEEEIAVSEWLAARRREGLPPDEIAVFVRSDAQLPRARRAAAAGGFAVHELQENIELQADSISIATLHLAKGLEFKAVVVMACDDEIIPLQERIDGVGDEADLEDVFDAERHLLYVGCTRARDHLLLTSAEPASEFLDDF